MHPMENWVMSGKMVNLKIENQLATIIMFIRGIKYYEKDVDSFVKYFYHFCYR